MDTSVWYAALDGGDAHHREAGSLLSEHAGSLVTSDHVLTELWNLTAARVHHHAANQAVSAISDGVARIECCTAADLRRAMQVPEVFSRQAFSLTDCTSWALMERLGITVALSLDTDFRVYRYGPQRDRYFTVHP